MMKSFSGDLTLHSEDRYRDHLGNTCSRPLPAIGLSASEVSNEAIAGFRSCADTDMHVTATLAKPVTWCA